MTDNGAQSAVHSDLAGFYDQRYQGGYMDAHPALEICRVEETLQEIPGPVASILDYGCGQGAWFPSLATIFTDAQITGVEISSTAVAIAREHFARGNFHCFDGGRAPFPDASFDLVFSFHVLEHVVDLELTVADMCRLTRSGGWICVILPCGNPGSFEHRVARLVQNGIEPASDGRELFFYEDEGHIRRLGSHELADMLSTNGATIQRAFFANQLWGGVEWIGKGGSTLHRTLFHSRRGRNTVARIELWLLGAFFALLGVLFRIDAARLRARPLLPVLLLLKAVALPVTAAIEWLAAREWRIHRTRENGSEQYLLARRA